MSKWGYQSIETVLRLMNRKNGKQEAAEMIAGMSKTILDQEREAALLKKTISEQKDEIRVAEIEKGLARAAEAHMRGYIERVKELDPQHEKEEK